MRYTNTDSDGFANGYAGYPNADSNSNAYLNTNTSDTDTDSGYTNANSYSHTERVTDLRAELDLRS